MDEIDNYRQAIKNILREYEKIPYAYGDMKCKAVCFPPKSRQKIASFKVESFAVVIPFTFTFLRLKSRFNQPYFY